MPISMAIPDNPSCLTAFYIPLGYHFPANMQYSKHAPAFFWPPVFALSLLPLAHNPSPLYVEILFVRKHSAHGHSLLESSLWQDEIIYTYPLL